MNSVKFDNQELIGSPYITRIVSHESSADRSIITNPLSREDGSIFVSSRYGEKKIIIEGILSEVTPGDLESQIDTMLELISREQKNLDIAWNGTTRRYIATCKKHEFNRDHFHITWVPFSLEFVVPSGKGTETSTTKAIDNVQYDTTSEVAISPVIAGGAKPKPVITLTGSSWPTGCLGFSLTNSDTGERFIFARNASWGTTSVVEINCLLQKITHTIGGIATVCDFAGLLPSFFIGTNHFKLKVGAIVNQTTKEAAIGDVQEGGIITYWASGEKHRVGQAFSIPYTDQTIQGVRIAILKAGTPPANLTCQIETDTSGSPSGTIVSSNATMTKSRNDITTSMAYYELMFPAAFTLQANTKYWIVLKAEGSTGTDGSEFIIGYLTDATKIYTDGGYITAAGNPTPTWGTPHTDQSIAFEILSGGLGGSSHVNATIEYLKTYL